WDRRTPGLAFILPLHTGGWYPRPFAAPLRNTMESRKSARRGGAHRQGGRGRRGEGTCHRGGAMTRMRSRHSRPLLALSIAVLATLVVGGCAGATAGTSPAAPPPGGARLPPVPSRTGA